MYPNIKHQSESINGTRSASSATKMILDYDDVDLERIWEENDSATDDEIRRDGAEMAEIKEEDERLKIFDVITLSDLEDTADTPDVEVLE